MYALSRAGIAGLCVFGLLACSGGSGSGGGSSPNNPMPDATAPIVTITGPVSSATHTTTSPVLNLAGSASDDTGVTAVSWSNDRGGSGNAAGTGSWSVSGIALQSGTNLLTVTARDAAGNSGTDTISVTYNTSSSYTPSPSPSSIFVAENGNDTSGDGSFSRPYRTIGRAVSVVNPGQTIEVRAGANYCGTLISRPGTPNGWITLRPYNGEAVRVIPCGRADVVYFYNDGFAPMYWIMQGLEVQGGTGYTVKIDTPHVKLINNNLHSAALDIVKIVGTADDVVLFGNEIHSNIAANGANAQGVDIVGADRTWVAYNHVHDIPSIGMYAKGNARNTVFENNRVENIYARGIMLGQSTDQALMTDGPYEAYDGIIRNNVIVNTGDACLATASAYNIKIYNNSCYNAATRAQAAIFLSNESETPQGGTLIDIKNNIVYAAADTTRPVVKIGAAALTSDSAVSFDRNLYWSGAGASAVTFLWEDRGLNNVSLSAWRSATGNDAASLAGDPVYADTTLLTLNAASPAINAGINTSLVPSDYLGAARPFGAGTDIGAYETGGAAPTQGATTLPAPAAAAQLFRYPYLQTDAPHRMRVLWATPTEGNGLVRYRRASDSGWRSAVSQRRVFAAATTGLTADFVLHEAVLESLTPDTQYVYDVVHDGTTLAKAVPFKTVVADTNAPVNFIVVGDSGTEWEEPRRIRDAIASVDGNGDFIYPHDFVIGVGDLAYYDGSYTDFNRRFFDQLSGKYEGDGRTSILATRPYFPALGNHEYDQVPTATPSAYLESFALPIPAGVPAQDAERYYSFDAGDAHFAVIDSMRFEGDTTATRLQPMLDWLAADLAATTKTWRLVFFHHTIFSHGDHGVYGDVVQNRRLRQLLAPIMQTHGVQLVMFGHDHLYQRSKRMRVDSQGQVVRDTNCNIIESLEGIVYIASGNGGADLHPKRIEPGACGSAQYAANMRDYGDNYDFIAVRNGDEVIFHRDSIAPAIRFGFTHVRLLGNTATVTAYNYDGEIMDQFSLSAN